MCYSGTGERSARAGKKISRRPRLPGCQGRLKVKIYLAMAIELVQASGTYYVPCALGTNKYPEGQVWTPPMQFHRWSWPMIGRCREEVPGLAWAPGSLPHRLPLVIPCLQSLCHVPTCTLVLHAHGCGIQPKLPPNKDGRDDMMLCGFHEPKSAYDCPKQVVGIVSHPSLLSCRSPWDNIFAYSQLLNSCPSQLTLISRSHTSTPQLHICSV